jgi:hypothetical protein
MTTTLDAFDTIVIKEWIAGRPKRVTYVKNTRSRRIATSQLARDVQRHGALVGGVLAAVVCGVHSLVGAL